MWQGRPYIRYGPGADRALGSGSSSSAMGKVGRVSGHPGGLRARRGAWHDDRRPCAVRGAGVGSRSQGGLSRPAGEPCRRRVAARLRVGGRPVEHDQRALRHFFLSGGHRLPREGGVPHGFLPQRSGHRREIRHPSDDGVPVQHGVHRREPGCGLAAPPPHYLMYAAVYPVQRADGRGLPVRLCPVPCGYGPARGARRELP